MRFSFFEDSLRTHLDPITAAYKVDQFTFFWAGCRCHRSAILLGVNPLWPCSAALRRPQRHREGFSIEYSDSAGGTCPDWIAARHGGEWRRRHASSGKRHRGGAYTSMHVSGAGKAARPTAESLKGDMRREEGRPWAAAALIGANRSFTRQTSAGVVYHTSFY